MSEEYEARRRAKKLERGHERRLRRQPKQAAFWQTRYRATGDELLPLAMVTSFSCIRAKNLVSDPKMTTSIHSENMQFTSGEPKMAFLNCPCCNSTAIQTREIAVPWHSSSDSSCQIMCLNCGLNVMSPLLAEAARKWNTRPPKTDSAYSASLVPGEHSASKDGTNHEAENPRFKQSSIDPGSIDPGVAPYPYPGYPGHNAKMMSTDPAQDQGLKADFLMLFAEGGNAPTIKHQSYESAANEADNIIFKSGKVVYLLRPIEKRELGDRPVKATAMTEVAANLHILDAYKMAPKRSQC